MLSPGKYHLQVPRAPLANLRFRRSVLKAALRSRKVQRGLLAMCERDILFWINVFVWQHNPAHLDEEIGPFITWPFQEEALRRTIERIWHQRKDAVWEKSREVGASWLALFLDCWGAMFHHNKKFLVMSRNEKAVDSPDDSDSLFWKLDFMIENLPAWMADFARRKLGMKSHRTRSQITGAANTDGAGVGGRSTHVLLDEFAKQPNAAAIRSNTADLGPRLYVSTHYGVGTDFYDLCSQPDVWKIQMHWSQHPEKAVGLYHWDQDEQKIVVHDTGFVYHPQCSRCLAMLPGEAVGNPSSCCQRVIQDFQFTMDGSPTGGPFPGIRSPWYDEECRRRGSDRDVAMHLDIDPSGSDARFYPVLLIKELRRRCPPPLVRADVLFDRATGTFLGLKPNENGKLKMWTYMTATGKLPASTYAAGADIAWGTGATPSCFCAGDGRTGRKILEYEDADMEPYLFAPLCVALCKWMADHDGNGARFCWEMQGPGISFGKHVLATGYRNIYYRTNETVPDGFAKVTMETPGWVPTPNNTKIAHDEYASALKLGDITNPSERALAGCMDFVLTPNGGVYSGKTKAAVDDPHKARESHGDLVIGDVLMWKMMKPMIRLTEAAAKQSPGSGSLAWRRSLHKNLEREQAWT